MRIGVDIGGTFTDFVFLDQETGEIRIWKTITTYPDPSEGVIRGLSSVLGDSSQALAPVQQLVHGTTLGANTIIERKGAKTALLTTRGFRDVLEIQRQRRPNLYDMFQDKPVPLIPRHNVAEVTERMAYDGTVRRSLAEDEVIGLADQIAEAGFQAVAISFLHAYANATHERRTREILQDRLDGLPIAISSEVAPKYREYERTNTTVANAYLLPIMRTYLQRLGNELRAGGYESTLFIMQSNGGITTAEVASEYPVRVVESGPAAGAIAAAYLAEHADLADVIAFDMGGTTAKVSLIEGGVLNTTDEFEIDRRNLVPESGLPLSIPAIELIEIGAGGGSIASLTMGTITVGPESTGADPGPICYGKQVEYPTVTDADLVLGYLDPDYFLGGEIALDEASAHTGLKRAIADPLNLSVEQAAWGIHEVVNTNMALAMREATIRQGYDPRDSAIVAFGGAGPVHACRLARDLGVPRVFVPSNAGVNSALGLLVAGSRFDQVRTFVTGLDDVAPAQVCEIYDELADRAAELLRASRVETAPTLVRSADMRYVGQGYEVTVPVPDSAISATTLDRIRDAFEEVYEKRYGFRNSNAPVEVVNWRLMATAEQTGLSLARSTAHAVSTLEEACKGYRRAYFPEMGGYTSCGVYDWYRLPTNHRIEGPAVVEARETSAIILPHDTATIDSYGNLLINIHPENIEDIRRGLG